MVRSTQGVHETLDMMPLRPVAAVQHHEVSARYAGIRLFTGRTIQQSAP
jgi:hypothetical protein